MFSQEWWRFVSEVRSGPTRKEKTRRGKTEEGVVAGKSTLILLRKARPVYPIRRFTHDVSPFDGDEIPREKNFSKRGPRGVGSVALEKTIKNDSRDEKHERQDRLLNEINEKQRSAGGFNPL